MAPEEVQSLADARERDNAQRYERLHEFSLVVADAVRRADALRRLELSLVYTRDDERPAS